MPSTSLQFHCAPVEAVPLIHQWTENLDVHFAVSSGIGHDMIAGLLVPGSPLWWICVSLTPVEVGVSRDVFLHRYPDVLSFHVPAVTDEGVREAALMARSEDASSVGVWRNLIRRARTPMLQGAVVRNPMTGAETPRPRHRYTPGARALAEAGVPLLAAGGWNQYLLLPTQTTGEHQRHG